MLADALTMQRGLACAIGIIATAISPLLSGCLLLAGRHWDETRRTVINPINTTLHRHLPRDIQAKDLDAILRVYATDTGTGLPWNEPVEAWVGSPERHVRWVGPVAPEPIRERYRKLLGLFESIDKAELRIRRVYWDDHNPHGYPADVRLLVRGVGPDNERRTLDQRARVWIDRRGDDWVLTGEEITARDLIGSRQPLFDLATEAAGIRDTHDSSGSPPFRLIGNTAASSGSAVADIDCDGFEDLALLSSPRIALYRNGGDGTFSDVTASAGMSGALDIAGTGLVFFDADNDGDPDLWLSGIRGDRFFRNDGCAVFVDATAEAGIGPSRWSSMPTVADFDRDGLLDVYVARMGDHATTAPTPNWDARNGVPHGLYRNLGNGRFADVTQAAGIHETGWGLAAAWGDYDDDGFPDLYVGNEFGTNSLYRNNGDGTFRNVAAAAGALDRGAAMGVTWGDYDDDDDLDIYVSNMYANSRWALFHPDFPPPVPWYFSWVPRSDIDAVTDDVTRGGSLLRNNGDGTFSDVSDAAGVRDCQWGWAAEFLDYDNDGRLDLYCANGFISGPILDDV